ncbi:mechanosensitive ion channel family protein [Gottschalkiaceae bacterium SANA]|nr:mechanosensitive ion channel family protein [Gottschalkiaceae bacterium SANA]
MKQVLEWSLMGISMERILIALGVFIGFRILIRVGFPRYQRLLERIFSRFQLKTFDQVNQAFRNPVKWILNIVNLYVSFRIILGAHYPNWEGKVPAGLDKGVRIAGIMIVTYALVQASKLLEQRIESAAASHIQLEAKGAVNRMIGKILQVVILVISVSILLNEFGYNLNSLVAGLGIGSLAIALAAQDTISNFVAGIFIILDGHFDLGDIVRIGSEEGVVEEIKFRTTRIRTFEKEMIIMPNSNIANSPVYNYSRRQQRRVKYQLGVVYGTKAETLKKIQGGMKDLIQAHPQVDENSVMVRFTEFGDSSLNFLITYFADSSEYGTLMEVRETVNLEILNYLEKEGVGIAFPSQSVYFENPLIISDEKR